MFKILKNYESSMIRQLADDALINYVISKCCETVTPITFSLI